MIQNINALTLTAAAASVNGGDIGNTSASGCVAVIDVTAISGTSPSLTVTIEGKDSLSGKYYTILQSAALTAVGTTVLRIHPAMTAAANTVAADMMPDAFRVTAAIAGTTPSVTATVAAILVE